MIYVRIATGVNYYDFFFIMNVELGAYLVLNLIIAVVFDYLGNTFEYVEKQRLL
jgi:hypothetical protein